MVRGDDGPAGRPASEDRPPRRLFAAGDDDHVGRGDQFGERLAFQMAGQADGVFQQEVAGVDAQRPVERAVADHDEPGLRVVLEDGGQRLDEQVLAVRLTQVADANDGRVHRADLEAGLDRARIEPALERRGGEGLPGVDGSIGDFRDPVFADFGRSRVVEQDGLRLAQGAPLDLVDLPREVAAQVAALALQRMERRDHRRLADAVQQRQGRGGGPLETHQRNRRPVGGELAQEGVDGPVRELIDLSHQTGALTLADRVNDHVVGRLEGVPREDVDRRPTPRQRGNQPAGAAADEAVRGVEAKHGERRALAAGRLRGDRSPVVRNANDPLDGVAVAAAGGVPFRHDPESMASDRRRCHSVSPSRNLQNLLPPPHQSVSVS